MKKLQLLAENFVDSTLLVRSRESFYTGLVTTAAFPSRASL